MGDFYQLPPVNKSDDKDGNKFCFESEDWFGIFPQSNHILLTKIFRQDDDDYKKILMNIRKGVFDESTKKILETRIIKFENNDNQTTGNQTTGNQMSDNEHNNIIKIFPLKNNVDIVNISNFVNLEGQKYVNVTTIRKDVKEFVDTKKVIPSKFIDAYNRASPKQVEYEVNYIRGNNPSVNELQIKVGARVMCIINLDMDNGVCNGSQGIVDKIITGNVKRIEDFLYMRKAL